MTPDPIEARLLALEANDAAIRAADLEKLAPLARELTKIPVRTLADRLLAWEIAAPSAVDLLLRRAAKDERLALHVAGALVQILTTWKEGQGPWVGVDDVLVRAFPKLKAPERDWVAERTAVREKYRLVPGRDYVAMGEPKDQDQWPFGQPLPPIDEVRGIQARLLRAGYNAGPITNAWNDATKRALVRYQIEHALPPSGALDHETKIRLIEEE